MPIPHIPISDLATNSQEEHSWFSNPLDWPSIDRLIALGIVSQAVAIFFNLALIMAWYFQVKSPLTSTYLNTNIAGFLVLLFSAYWVLASSFTLAAFKKRKSAQDWPLFSNVIVFSFVVVVMILGYLTGTYFSEAIVLLLFGFALCLPLVNLEILARVYLFAWAIFIFFIIADFAELTEFAPLFVNAPVEGQRPVLGWHILRVLVSFSIFVILFFVTLPSTKRWRDREDLYREMSSTDGLTRLTNRRSFIDRSNAEFSKLERMPGKLACIMMDLDYFKHVNDNYGHLAGDAVLVKVAQILADNAREYDEVGRYGGEEFAILLPDADASVAAAIAERIRALIEVTEIDAEGHCLKVTASFGVAACPAEGVSNINDLLKKADDALYQAKEKSRNTVVVSE